MDSGPLMTVEELADGIAVTDALDEEMLTLESEVDNAYSLWRDNFGHSNRGNKGGIVTAVSARLCFTTSTTGAIHAPRCWESHYVFSWKIGGVIGGMRQVGSWARQQLHESMHIHGNTFRAAALTGVWTLAFFGLSAAVGAGVVTVGIAAYLAYQCFNGDGGNPVNGRRLPAFLV